MTAEEFDNAWVRMSELWAGWAARCESEYPAWLKQFMRYNLADIIHAIQRHFEERGKKKSWQFAPDNTRIAELTQEFHRAASATGKSDAQVAYETAFYAADKLTQTRMIIQSIRLRLSRDDFGKHNRDYWEAALSIANKQEQRLRFTPAEREAYWTVHQEKYCSDPAKVRETAVRTKPRDPKQLGAMMTNKLLTASSPASSAAQSFPAGGA